MIGEGARYPVYIKLGLSPTVFQPSSLIRLKYMEHLYKLLTADALTAQMFWVYFKTAGKNYGEPVSHGQAV